MERQNRPAASVPRTLGIGDYQVTRIGLGTNRLTDTPGHRDFLVQAIESGIDFIDTAHLYTGGDSERTIGAALAPFPDDLVVGTKGAYERGDGRPERLRAEVEESFEALRTDTIPLHYLHRVDPEVPLEESLGVLREHRDSGRIQNIGISNVSVDQIERARKVVPIAAVQNHYSLSERQHEDEVDYCDRENIAFVPYFPLRGVKGAPLEEIAGRYDATPKQVALAWLLKRSPQIAPIPGTLSIDHLRSNLSAIDIELSDDDFAQLSGDQPARS
jgi:pyridoxine 4-dehydrogenase